jgi:hypothetical protein
VILRACNNAVQEFTYEAWFYCDDPPKPKFKKPPEKPPVKKNRRSSTR